MDYFNFSLHTSVQHSYFMGNQCFGISFCLPGPKTFLKNLIYLESGILQQLHTYLHLNRGYQVGKYIVLCILQCKSSEEISPHRLQSKKHMLRTLDCRDIELKKYHNSRNNQKYNN